MEDPIAAAVVRICFSLPLFYIGLVMTLDAAGFVRSLESLASELRTFEQRLHGIPIRQLQTELPSGTSLLAVRPVGAAITAAAVLNLLPLLY